MANLGKFNWRFTVVLVLTLFVLLLPTPQNLPQAGKAALAAFVFTSSIFTLQPVSLPFASLMVFVSMVVLGVADSSQAFQALSRPIVILILGSLFIAETLRKHGLTRRLALISIVTSRGDIRRLLLGFMGMAALLSMWMENTATAAVLIPVALTISNQIEDKNQAKEVTLLLVLGIAYSASLGGMVTITGSASNAVASGFLAETMKWTFLDWMKYGFPAFIVVFPVTWWILERLIKVSVRRMDITLAKNELSLLGPLRPVEWEIIVIINITVILWITGSYIETLFVLPVTVLSPSVVSMVVVAYLAIRRIIVWEDVQDVGWGMIFIIGAGLALGEAMVRTGATDWLTIPITPLLTSVPFLISLLFLVFSGALLTNVINNATVVAVFTPILISIAKRDPSIEVLQLVVPLTLATTFGYSLPSASGRMALISATGILERRDMIRYGIVITLISSFILSALFYIFILLGWI
jgi:sodium-dependent dicarboxylate transporter 2/3/5